MENQKATDGTVGQDVARYAVLWLPLFFGLLALALGQDDSWDLRNYHLYNPYALLHDRHGIDLAPAGLQSYFNPLLDLFQAYLFRLLPAPLMGFVLGWLQGLAAILLMAIGRRLLPVDSSPRRILGLALAGCFSAAFLSELGNTMGDNLTALLVLGGVLFALDVAGPMARRKLVLAGLLLGLATGLKLTNAVYAVGLAGALLGVPPKRGQRMSSVALLTIGGLAGLMLTSGYWFWHLWQLFGNPLFPQFGSLLPNTLAANIAVADVRTLPHSVWEWLLWPLVITIDTHRLGLKVQYQLAWPALYFLYIAWAGSALARRSPPAEASERERSFQRLAVFVAVSFVVWTGVFSIYRYLAPMELLAPLLCWLLVHRVFPAQWSVRVGTWLVAALAAFGLFNYWSGWGHASWTAEAFRVENPVGPTDPRASVLLVGPDPGAWRIPFMPAQWAYIGIGSNFPAGLGYVPRVKAILHERGGPVYIMLPSATYPRVDYIAKLNRAAALLRMGHGADGCKRLEGLRRHLKLKAQVAPEANLEACHFQLRDQDRVDLSALDMSTEKQALEMLAPLNLHFDPADCRRYQSWIGGAEFPYLWCSATPNR